MLRVAVAQVACRLTWAVCLLAVLSQYRKVTGYDIREQAFKFIVSLISGVSRTFLLGWCYGLWPYFSPVFWVRGWAESESSRFCVNLCVFL